MRTSSDTQFRLFLFAPVYTITLLASALSTAADVETSPAKTGNPLPMEIARFTPPTDVPKEAPAWIYAASARPMGIFTFPQYVLDKDPETAWSSKDREQWVTLFISHPVDLSTIDITFTTKGVTQFRVDTSLDGKEWTTVYSGECPDTPQQSVTYPLEPTTARYLRITPNRISKWGQEHWKSISEVQIPGLEYKPSAEMQWWSKTWASYPPSDEYLAQHKPVARGTYTEVAAQTLATLMEYGTDRYGPVHSPIWVLNLDVATLNCFPRYNDDLERAPASWLAPYGLGQRAIRPGQRPGGSANLFVDQPMIRAAVLHDLLADTKRFTPAVAAHVETYCQKFTRPDGLIEWGNHLSQNVYSEELQHDGGDNKDKHELLGALIQWPTLYQIEPEIIRREMEQFWYWHTDEETGETDRHSSARPKGHGLAFASSSADILLACAYLHTQSPDEPWLERALLIARYHWDTRDPATNLFVNVPSTSPTAKPRFDNVHFDTTITGAWASRVYMAGRLTGNPELIDMAQKTLLAWAKYGWDDAAQEPWASLLPDGTPHEGERNNAGTNYNKFDPVGHLDLWKDYVLGFESPMNTLLMYAIAADGLDDPKLKRHAVRLAEYVRRKLPANGKYGTMAENYGKTISFFLQMEQLTGDASYRQTAKQVADEALDHLWTGKLLVGFAGRTHYSAQEGSSYLIQALLELDADPDTLAKLRGENVFLWNL